MVPWTPVFLSFILNIYQAFAAISSSLPFFSLKAHQRLVSLLSVCNLKNIDVFSHNLNATQRFRIASESPFTIGLFRSVSKQGCVFNILNYIRPEIFMPLFLVCCAQGYFVFRSLQGEKAVIWFILMLSLWWYLKFQSISLDSACNSP